MIMYRIITLSAACHFCILLSANPARMTEDTLGLNVTFVGDREVLLRDAHKEMHWPQPARIETTKPTFNYPVLPKRLNVQPTWELQKAKRLKIEEPLPRLYRGFAEVGMGNYLSPVVRVNYSDLRSRNRSWGTEFQHESTRGGFPSRPEVLVETPDQFSHTSAEGWYKRFFQYGEAEFSSAYQRDRISYYGRVAGFEPSDSSLFPLGDSTIYHSWKNRAQFSTTDKPGRNWNVSAVTEYGMFWTDRNASEHNIDTRLRLRGELEGTPVELSIHNNIDRLNRQEEGFILPPQKQAIFDLHPKVSKSFSAVATEFGFGLWVDAQGNRPFLFIPEFKASVGLLQNLFVPYIELNGGVIQNRYETALEENPFIPAPDTNIVWNNTYEGIRAKGGMRGSITSAVAFELSAQFVKHDQHLFWIPNDPYGSGAGFRPLYQDMNIATLAANATWKMSPATEFAGHVSQHTYLFQDSIWSEMAAWNLPQFELSLQAGHTFKEKLHITTHIDLFAGRQGIQASELTTTDIGIMDNASQSLVGFVYDMDDFVNWGLTVRYIYNARLNAWISGENLLNRPNPLFVGYNSQGIRFQLGFNYAF